MNPFSKTLLACALLLPVSVVAQDKKAPDPTGAAKLAALLQDLESLAPDAWNQRVQELETKIAAHGKAAADLRKRAKELQSKATREDDAAKAVRAEIERLRSLMALVKPKGKPTPKKAPAKKVAEATAAKPKAKPKAAMKKAPAKKPAPKKKAAPKKATPKKQAPKKATPKKKAPPPAMAAAAAPKAKNVAPAKAAPPPKVQVVSYVEHLQPLLEERCTVCHDEEDSSGGLDLSTYGRAIEGGSSGATIAPGNPEGSRLFLMVSKQERPFMPKDDDPLSKAEVEMIRAWIALGAPEDTASAEAAAEKLRKKLSEEAAQRAAPQPTNAPVMPQNWKPVALTEVVRPPAVKTIASSPHAPLAAIAGQHQVLLVHTESLETIGVLPFALGQVEVLRFTSDGRKLLAAGGRPGKRGGAILFDVATGHAIAEFGPERDTVLAAAISPGQSIVALGGPSRRVRAYATETGERLYEIRAHNDWVLSADISPDGNYLVTTDRAGIVQVHEADTGRDVHTINPKGGSANAVAFRPDAKAFAVGTHDGRVRSYEIGDGKQLWSKVHGRDAVLGLAWSIDGSLTTCGVDGRARRWNRNGGELARSPALKEWAYSVAWSTSKRTLVGDWAGRVHVLDATGKKVDTAIQPAVAGPSS